MTLPVAYLTMMTTCLQLSHVATGSVRWFVDVGISLVQVLFAGLMSGLILGLLSLNLMELEILQRSGSPVEKKQAGAYEFAYSYFFIFSLILSLSLKSHCQC